MLFSLHIKNIALLDDVEIEFTDGFNVLSGETGAGKSILISSINLLLGERANRELIRHGADRAEVTGLFYVENAAQRATLTELGIETEEDGALLITRTLLLDGKNLCRIGGRPATVAELRDVSQYLVNIHGQHDSQALLNPAEHIHFLDSFLPTEGKAKLSDYCAAFHAWKELQHLAESLETDEAERLRKIDMLTYEAEEIRDANITLGEEEDLKRRRDLINHRLHLEQQVGQTLSALSDNSEGADARGALSVALKALENAAALDESLSPTAEQLLTASELVEDVSRTLRSYFDRLSEGDELIDDIEERLDLLYRLKRKYGNSLEEVLAYADRAEAELADLKKAENEKEHLAEHLAEAEENVRSLASALSTLRKDAAAQIEAAINENLHFLNMPDADFSVSFTECNPHSFGAEQIIFLIKTNSGEVHLPLTKIVSGGELSRIMLAIKSVLTDGDAIGTLIFDEIDSGVSGSAAQKIGRKLRQLAKSKQVLCVTHLAQIAAMADTHFLIEKQSADGRTKTNVSPMSHEMRVQELARIISGDLITETTLKQAEELIQFGQEDC